MSDEEIRRIRRLVVGDPQIPPPLPDLRQAERFHRALGAVRRVASANDAAPESATAAAVPPPEPVPPPRQEGTHPSPASAAAPPSRERAERHERKDTSPSSRKRDPSRPEGALVVDGHRPRPPVLAAAEAGAREASEAQEADADQDVALDTVTAPPMPIPHVAWTPLPEGWERELADTVATLCRSSEPNFHSWTIQVPVDAETLPHTELRLSFSPHQLTLRFSTQSTRSLALISAHQSQLRALLVRALPGDRHIEIDIT
ncbi:type III secretion HpaP family protein [Roseateles chitinivorans]|uniref:type III secretion HpaP family protein n=1 Tax=Roseateles chitinivorans TaxID=2917965 RepID=UPI003D679176